ncbi:cytochrome bc1 complex cytochrome b subunit [Streptomyces sp. NBC_00525]|uniref:cytochrome bc1 complex cytochrome b subunit n=1 Tax=Streptomyces sp. NBC_00525 TaxID=2903660 RepID=UPI002E816B7B|nr:ubiquinol-cytochrome c reductase cytochrome b subunit [Streptomyces sp. NBC_00525]WUC92168.1 ubiquinol-cytochrome c reductase cytochrome b subunit [Streptomyces sp. NBC_00525]
MRLFKAKEQVEARARSAGARAADAVDARLPLAGAARALLRKAFPDHWSFLLGELALYSFVVLVVTGVYLTLFFQPSMTESVYLGSYAPLRGVRVSEAYASTLRISFDVRGGLLIRQIHHWAALVFVASIGAHMLRVFFTGAFRRPREVNWTVGVTMFLLALLEGFAGYSLPDDLLSGTGLRTAQGIMLSIPVVGTYLSFFVFGGEYPGDDIVSRLYPVHILLVPGLLLALISLHLLLVVHLKHTQWAGPGRTGRNVVGKPLLPQYAAKSAGLFFIVFGVLAVLGAVAQINPIWDYGPYHTDQVSTGSQPDWYVGFLEGALRLMPGVETRLWGHTLMWNPLVPGVLLPGALFLVLYAYPFFERWITGGSGERHLCDRPRDRPVRTGLGVGALTAYAVLLLAGGQDVIAAVFDVPVHGLTWVFRIALVVLPPVAFVVTDRLCLALQAHDRELLTDGEETGGVEQSVEGGYHPEHAPLPEEKRYALLARELPRPLDVPAPRCAAARTRFARRLRARLSHWYYRDQVRPGMTPEQEREAEELLAGPRRPGDQRAGSGFWNTKP